MGGVKEVKTKKALLLYLPVFHRGYLTFFQTHRDHDIFLISDLFAKELSEREEYKDEVSLRSLVRDPRCLNTPFVAKTLKCVLDGSGDLNVSLVDCVEVLYVLGEYESVVMPNEQICHFLHKTFGSDWRGVEFAQTFLRWDMPKSLSRVDDSSHEIVTVGVLQEAGLYPHLEEAREIANRSSDWWRQVGAVLAKDGKRLISAWNQHLPHELVNYFAGDPRSNFNAGEHIEISAAAHAEATIVAKAASMEGVSVKGGDLFSRVFPCPPCSTVIAISGISRVYFEEGYSLTIAQEILDAYGVETFRVVK